MLDPALVSWASACSDLWGWSEAQWLPIAPDTHYNALGWDPPLAPPNLSLSTAYSPVVARGYSGQQQLFQRQTLASWCHLCTNFSGVLCSPLPVCLLGLIPLQAMGSEQGNRSAAD